MKFPNFSEEKKLWKKGYKRIVSLDEVGRGALAGPVIAAAVSINPKFKYKNSKQIPIFKFLNLKIRDSKKLSSKKRKRFYNLLTKNLVIEWAIGRVSERVIDKINILEATKLAMKKAIKNLKIKLEVDFLILDGKMKLDLSLPQKSIIKADEKVFSCAVASIIAKVTRDKIMEKYGKKYPQYGFNKHKGYPTKLHLAKLKKYGFCKIHRKTFSSSFTNKFLY